MHPHHCHGEYKVPGGKLVVVDLEHDDSVITALSLSGDFFLEPDEALERISSSLAGTPRDTPTTELAELVRRGAGDDAHFIGFSPEAVATAIRRALGKATTWDDHEWTVLPPVTLPPAVNVALDEVLSRAVGAGARGPTLRLWDWDAPAAVIGSFQSVANEIDADGARRHGVQVIRRISGGGAMFMEPGNCVTYSLYAPVSLVDGMSFEASYKFLDQWVLDALADMGVQATYKPLNDIATEHGKIGGAAQKRFANGVVLHHVTMAYDIDADKMLEVLRVGKEKISDKGIRSAAKRVDPLKRQAGMGRAEILDFLGSHFTRRTGALPGALTDEELARAHELVDSKFTDPAWTGRVP